MMSKTLTIIFLITIFVASIYSHLLISYLTNTQHIDDAVLVKLQTTYKESRNITIGNANPAEMDKFTILAIRLTSFKYLIEFHSGYISYSLCIGKENIMLKLSLHFDIFTIFPTDLYYICNNRYCSKIQNFHPYECILVIDERKIDTDHNFNMTIGTRNLYFNYIINKWSNSLDKNVATNKKHYYVFDTADRNTYYYYQRLNGLHYLYYAKKQCTIIRKDVSKLLNYAEIDIKYPISNSFEVDNMC